MAPTTWSTAGWRDREDPARPRARSLLLTLLGEFVLPHPDPVWTRSLVAALRLLDIREGTARQALKRSAAAGWLEGERVGRESRWRLSTELRTTLEEGADRIYAFGSSERPEGCDWLLLQISVPESQRDLRERLRTQLAWIGFGSLGQGLWICPHTERRRDLESTLRQLDLVERATVFRARPESRTERRRMVERAWPLADIAERYRRFLEEFRRPRVTNDAEAFAALTRLVHAWRAFPLLDPQLPEELEPRHWPGGRATRRFQELRGRWRPRAVACWQELCE